MAAANTSHLLLTRIDHEAKVLNVMRNLFEDGQLTDVTLACEGQLIHAHKLILSSVSNYFQTIFQNSMLKSQSNPVILVKDMKMADLKAIIEFIYSGEVRICGDQLESLVRSAETLDISGLNRIDPNPTNHVSQNSSKTSTENDISSSDENGSSGQSNGNLPGKSNSHHFQDSSSLKRKESTEKSAFDKKVPSAVSHPVRSTRSSDRRAPIESSESKSKASQGNVKRGAQENISGTRNNHSSKLEDSSRRESFRYNFRAKLKEDEISEKITRSEIQNKPGNNASDQKSLRDRKSSSICESTPNVKNSNGKKNFDQSKNENIGDCLKELVVGQQLSNISNKTPEFKKPLEPVKRNCKLMNLYEEASGSSKAEVADLSHPPDATDEEMGSLLRQFVCDKDNLKMNLKRDDDVQSVTSVTTRSRRSKLLQGCEKQDAKTTSTNQSVATTRARRAVVDSFTSNPRPINLRPTKSRQSKVAKNRPKTIPRTSNQTVTVKGTDSARWKARTAKLKAATTRLSAKGRPNKVDLKAWFESQQKINQNALNKRKRENQVKVDRNSSAPKCDNSNENNKTIDLHRSNVSSRILNSSICLQDLGQEQKQEQQSLKTQPQNQNLNQNGLQPQPTNTIPQHSSDLDDHGNYLKTKRKPNDQVHDDSSKCDPMVKISTRSLRPKRVKTSSDTSSDAPPNTSTLCVSNCTIVSATTVSSSSPSSISSIQLSDSNV